MAKMHCFGQQLTIVFHQTELTDYLVHLHPSGFQPSLLVKKDLLVSSAKATFYCLCQGTDVEYLHLNSLYLQQNDGVDCLE